MKQSNKRPSFNVRKNVTFKNKFNSDTYTGDLINEDSIDGKLFYVVRKDSKVFKLSKESYSASFPR